MRGKTRPIYECLSDERLKTKDEKSTRLAYTEYERLFLNKCSCLLLIVVYYETKKKKCCLLLIDKARAKDKTYI